MKKIIYLMSIILTMQLSSCIVAEPRPAPHVHHYWYQWHYWHHAHPAPHVNVHHDSRGGGSRGSNWHPRR